MMTGTKQWTLAPPTFWRKLKPKCVGKNEGLCWAGVKNPNVPTTAREQSIVDGLKTVTFDLMLGHVITMW